MIFCYFITNYYYFVFDVPWCKKETPSSFSYNRKICHCEPFFTFSILLTSELGCWQNLSSVKLVGSLWSNALVRVSEALESCGIPARVIWNIWKPVEGSFLHVFAITLARNTFKTLRSSLQVCAVSARACAGEAWSRTTAAASRRPTTGCTTIRWNLPAFWRPGTYLVKASPRRRPLANPAPPPAPRAPFVSCSRTRELHTHTPFSSQ